jgi:aspartyl protease family protein
MAMPRIILAAGLLLASTASAQTVTLNGSMGSRQALLVIDGVPRVVEVGASVLGVRLLSLSGTQAEIEAAGTRRTLVAGAGAVRIGSAANAAAGGNEIVLTAGRSTARP